MIKAILWDLDGVLIESENITRDRWIATYRDLGFTVPPEIFYQVLGMRPNDVFYFINKTLNFNTTLTFDDFYKVHKKNRGENPGVPLVKNAEEILKQLHPQFAMAVVTSSSMNWIQKMLAPIPYTQYFQVFITGEDVQLPKPDPQPYAIAIEKLEVLPQESIVVEDATYGVQSGKAAGATVIARQAEHNKVQDLSHADYIISDLREITQIIKSL